jgi:hypothetical protein
MEYGIWNIEYGIWNMGYRTWNMVQKEICLLHVCLLFLFYVVYILIRYFALTLLSSQKNEFVHNFHYVIVPFGFAIQHVWQKKEKVNALWNMESKF